MTQLFYVHNKLNKWCNKHYQHPKWNSTGLMEEDMAIRLGNPNFEPLIYKLGFLGNNDVQFTFNDFDNWNKQLEEELEFEQTSIEEFNELYTALVNYKF